MGNNTGALLWPNRSVMQSIFALHPLNLTLSPTKRTSRFTEYTPLSADHTPQPEADTPQSINHTPQLAQHTPDSAQHASMTDEHTSQLLWPVNLIHELSERRSEHNFALPLAITTFVLSIILGIIIGPLQLILMASTADYTWVTSIYYPAALKCVLLISSFVAVLGLVALILAWRAQQAKARLTIILIAGSLAEILTVWFFGGVRAWQPHHLTLVFIIITLIFAVLALLASKQYTHPSAKLSPGVQISLTMLSALSVISVIIGPFYLSQTSSATNSAEVAELAAAQAQARVAGIPSLLSDLTFTLCNGKYQVLYFDEASASGLFECSESHEVYSVADPQLPTVNTVHGLAMYLGTTQNPAISRTFPTAYYLYHNLPEVLPEAELTLITSAFSETELLDNITQPILKYWQDHQTDLYLNIFYTNSLSTIDSTSDYVLLAALGTISMSDQLPHGNILQGYYNGKIVDYNFQPDTELTALNNFGATPALYPVAIREALRSHRHISVHLQTDATYDLDSMRELLQNSFTEAV